MFEEILPKGALDTIPSLLPILDPFYLAGGTGLALQLGHRSSEDLDFFSDQTFNSDAIITTISPDRIFYTSMGTIHCEINNTRVSFLYYKTPLTFPVLSWRGIRIAQFDDIVAEKIKTISQRGLRKDFIDLYAVLQLKYTVKEVCDRFKIRFKESDINYHHVLKSLIYFEDAESDPMPPMHSNTRDWKWEDIKQFFEGHISLFENELGL